MLSLRITFQAYIPKSLGKPLIEYFNNHKHFNPKDMINYDEFKRKLQTKSKLGSSTWIPEPLIGGIRDTFFATDNTDFHNHHTEHDKRLQITANIDLSKIGKFGVFDTVFTHNHGKFNHQHSDESHQVQVYIQKLSNYVDTGTTFIETSAVYKGIFNEEMPRRSEEYPLKTSVINKLSGTFFHQMGTRVENNTTIIKVAASAGYPFIWNSTHIDFELEIELIKDISSKKITVNIKGSHDDFPAYELLINGLVKYNYNPARHGYSGPTPYNLGMASRDFSATEWISLSDHDIKGNGKNNENFGW
ncbi:MAG: hypothetical protein L3J23_06415 [Flavobacteriaceae bacterium]|nr:hypothetical protein [Flavobacteriaceae bacterium]